MKAQLVLTLDSGKKITLSCDEVKELMTLLEAYRATTEPPPSPYVPCPAWPARPWSAGDIWVDTTPAVITTGTFLYGNRGPLPVSTC
jgi:hypothetical protein